MELASAIKIQKWGNSQGVRLPKDVLNRLGAHVGDAVTCDVKRDRLIFKFGKKTAYPTKKYRLEVLLSKIPSRRKNKEVKWGKAMGKEAW